MPGSRYPPAVLEGACERVHEGLGLDDAGVRRQEGRDAGRVRFAAADAGRVDDLEPLDAVGVALRPDGLEAGHLAVIERRR